MQIEITEKEKTALSLLLGLRQKFAKEKRENVSYSPIELHKLFSELINKINKNELKYLDTITVAHNSDRGFGKTRQSGEVWGEIDDAIERSKIKRYDWNKVFERSLTQEILNLKKIGLSVDDAFKKLAQDLRVKYFIEENKREKRKILENLKISVHARYGENNTAIKVMSDDDLVKGLPK